jgi:hypothetical protein
MAAEAAVRSLWHSLGALGAVCLVVGPSQVASAAAGDGLAPPPPPYDAPAAVVHVSWEHQDDLILLYDATTSADPLGTASAGEDAGWGGGCAPGALTGGEVLPLFLGGGPRDGADEAYNWSESPGTYSILVASNGYCVNPGPEGSEEARAVYEALPPGSTINVEARVELFAAGATAPEVQVLTMAVPVQLAAETSTVLGSVTVAAPAAAEEVTTPAPTPAAEATTPVPTTAGDAPATSDAPTGGSSVGRDEGFLRWLVDPKFWLAAALVFGLASLLFMVRLILKALRPWDPTHVVRAGTSASAVAIPDRVEDPRVTRTRLPDGETEDVVVGDSSVRVVEDVAGTDDVVIEFRDGTRARVNRRAIEPLEAHTW